LTDEDYTGASIIKHKPVLKIFLKIIYCDPQAPSMFFRLCRACKGLAVFLLTIKWHFNYYNFNS